MEMIRAMLNKTEMMLLEIENYYNFHPGRTGRCTMSRIKSSVSSLSLYFKSFEEEMDRDRLLYSFAVVLGTVLEIETLITNDSHNRVWKDMVLPENISEMKSGIKDIVNELLLHKEI